MSQQSILNEFFASTIRKKIQLKDDQATDLLIKLCEALAVSGLVFIYNEKLLDGYLELIQSHPTNNNLTFYCFINKNFPTFFSKIDILTKRKIPISEALDKNLTKQAEEILLVKQIKFSSANDLDSIVTQFFDILCIKDIYKQRPRINQLKIKILSLDDKGDSYRQYCINFLKKEIQNLGQYKQFLCCKFVYYYNDIIQSLESDIQQFKSYKWPISNENLVHHLKKTVVSFLNRRGGIIYIGLQQDKNKNVTVSGIYLQPQQRSQFIEFIKKKILSEVYPKFSYEKTSQQISYHNNALKYLLKKSSFQYYINQYISIAFIPIVDYKTLLNIKNVYMVLLKVKPGDQKQLYHLLSVKSPITPQFYVREDKSVRKRNLIEGINELTVRLNTYKQNKQVFLSYHTDCKFKLTPHEFQQDDITRLHNQIITKRIIDSVDIKRGFKKSSQRAKYDQQQQEMWP